MQIDLKNCVMQIVDGSSPAKELDVRIGEGTLTFSSKRNIEYKLNRGLIADDEVREGDQVPMDAKFDFVWEYLMGVDGTPDVPSIVEAIKGTGLAVTAGWVSSDDETCNPYSVDIIVTNTPVPAGCTDDGEVITLTHFRWESLDHD